MKTIIFAIIIALVNTIVWGQKKDDTIKIVEQKVASINQATNYKIVTIYNEAFLDTGFINQAGKGYGQLTGYFQTKNCSKIREQIGVKLLHDHATTEYYFKDEKLIFVHEEEVYNPNIFIDSAGTVDYRVAEPDFEGNYYFLNDKIVMVRTKGQQRILPNEMYFDSQSKEGQLLHSAEKYTRLLSQKQKQ